MSVVMFSYRPRQWKADYIAAADHSDLHASVTLSLSPTFTHVSTAAASEHAGRHVVVVNVYKHFFYFSNVILFL